MGTAFSGGHTPDDGRAHRGPSEPTLSMPSLAPSRTPGNETEGAPYRFADAASVAQIATTYLNTATADHARIISEVISSEYFGPDFGLLNPGRVRHLLGTLVIDEESWESLELQKLCASIAAAPEHGKSLAAVALEAGLCKLPTDPDIILLRQEAVSELTRSPQVQMGVAALLAKGHLEACIDLLRGPSLTGGWYGWYHQAVQTFRDFRDAVDSLPTPESVLLKEIFSRLKDALETDIALHLLGGTTFTRYGIEPTLRSPRSWIGNQLWPYQFSPIEIVPYLTAATLGIAGFVSNSNFALVGSVLSVLGGQLLSIGRQSSHANSVFGPMLRMMREQLIPGISAGFLLTELNALKCFASNAKLPTSFPTLVNASGLRWTATGMGNPLFTHNPHFVLNTIDICDARINVLQGPNSGGKSTFMKAGQLNLVVAQMGGEVVCERAVFSPANRIGYTVPFQNDSESAEGRFGTELQQIKRYLSLELGPRTFLAIDEIGSGTSEEAVAPAALDILDTLGFCGARIFVATHNKTIVGMLGDQYVLFHPEAVQADPGEDGPSVLFTKRILPGRFPEIVSTSMYVEEVLRRVGLDAKSLQRFRDEWKARHGDEA